MGGRDGGCGIGGCGSGCDIGSIFVCCCIRDSVGGCDVGGRNGSSGT